MNFSEVLDYIGNEFDSRLVELNRLQKKTIEILNDLIWNWEHDHDFYWDY